MNKVKFYYGYPVHVDIDTEKNVEVYIDQIPQTPIPEGAIRIVILEEPKKGDLFRWGIDKDNMHLYTHLLTFHDEILLSNSKAQLFHFPNTWVRDYFPIKEFSVSTVVGGKNVPTLEGHGLRHQLWNHRHLINIPKRFYLSGSAKNAHKFVPWKSVNYKGQLVLGASKEPLFDSMFHIAIENTSIANYFSEKLLDCFRTYTVPIYYGCTNIEDYFEGEGILQVHNVQEMVDVCNSLTADTYDGLYWAMEQNYDRARITWGDCWGMLKEKIIELI